VPEFQDFSPSKVVRPIPEKSTLQKFFRVGIQEKLILAFIAMGLVPMVISHQIAAQSYAESIYRDMRESLGRTEVIIREQMLRYEMAALDCCMKLSKDPDLVSALREADQVRIAEICGQAQSQHGLDIVKYSPPLTPEARREVEKDWDLGAPLRGILLGRWPAEQGGGTGQDTTLALVAGCRVEVVDQGEVLAQIVAGNLLGPTFAQDLGGATGTLILPQTVEDPSKLPELFEVRVDSPWDETEFWQEFQESKDPMYAEVEYEGKPFSALFLPLRGRSGKLNGAVMVGLLRSFSFSNIMEDPDFFYLSLFLDLVVATLLGITIARSISKPIRKLAKGVREVSAGNLDQNIKVRTRDEIQDLAASFNVMSEGLQLMKEMEEQLRVQDRLAALGELSAGVAHEIRNPLSIIKGSAEVLRKKLPEEDPRRELADFITSEVDRLNNVVTDFLQFARPNPPELTHEDVNDVVKRSVDMLSDRLVEKGIDLQTDFDADCDRTLLDKEKIHQVLLNLIINASQSMEDGGELIVRTSSAPLTKEVRIVIQDSGCGISEEDLQKIFNPFFTTKPSGTGLGLAIVQRILEAHGGRVEVSSTVGKGTCFVLILPVRSIMQEESSDETEVNGTLSRA